MAIPTFDQMLRPILALAGVQTITRRIAGTAMEEQFHLTQAERDARIPSGSSTYVHNRAGWAMTFLTKGGLISKVAPKTYAITEPGRSFLDAHPSAIPVKDLESPRSRSDRRGRSRAERQPGRA